MGKLSIITVLKMKIASMGWKLFIWGNDFKETEYWESIYQQEKAFKESNGLSL